MEATIPFQQFRKETFYPSVLKLTALAVDSSAHVAGH